MTKREKQQATNKLFVERVEVMYREWRMKRGKHDTTQNLLEFLVRHNFMREQIINRFVCLSEYERQLNATKSPKRPRGVKQQAIWQTEDIVPLGETQIKSNISHHYHYFRENRFKFP